MTPQANRGDAGVGGAPALRFTEVIRGHVSFGEDDCEAGRRAGREMGTDLRCRLTLEFDSVEGFVRDPRHEVTARGYVHCDALGGRLAVVDGRAHVLVGDVVPGRRRMIYRLHFHDAVGHPLTLSGVKTMSRRRTLPVDLWSDTTTLPIRIIRGHVEPTDDATAEVVASGVLRIHPADLPRQLASTRLGGPTRRERGRGLGRFLGFVVAEVLPVYTGPRTEAAPPDAAAGPRLMPSTSLPPGPRLPMPVQSVLWMLWSVPLMERYRKRFGDIFTQRLAWSGNVVQVCHPDGVRAVFRADPDIVRAGEANVVLEPLLGPHSILLLDGPAHLRQRRLMLPAFHGERMQRYRSLIEEVTEREVSSWTVGVPFPLRDASQRITLEVILRAIFGADEGSELDELRERTIAVLDFGHPIGLLPWFRRDLGAHSPWGRFLRRRQAADATIHALIRRRRAESPAGASRGSARDDILSLLLDARDEDGVALSDDELRDELVTLLVAGHETTATSIAWFFDLVLRDPEVLRRLEEDLAAGSGDYLDAAIKETLRLRPTLPVAARRLTTDLEVMGYRLPADTVVVASMLGVHGNEQVYERPQEFRPERFLGARTDAYGWLPFGGGIRRCLGASFATFEMRTVIPTVFGMVRLRHATGRPERAVRRAITLSPRGGTPVVVTERRSLLGAAEQGLLSDGARVSRGAAVHLRGHAASSSDAEQAT